MVAPAPVHTVDHPSTEMAPVTPHLNAPAKAAQRLEVVQRDLAPVASSPPRQVEQPFHRIAPTFKIRATLRRPPQRELSSTRSTSVPTVFALFGWTLRPLPLEDPE